MKSTVKSMGNEISQFMKEKEKYMVIQQEKDFILKNKMEASGNIRKTIAYRNVSTIACTVLMTNLGLSMFVSNIFTNPTPFCTFDAMNIGDLLQSPEYRNTATMNKVQDWYMSKYHEDYQMLQFSVSDLIHFYNPEIELLREDEKVTCEANFVEADKNYSITITFKYRFLALYQSLFNILRTIFIAIILIYNIWMNNADIKNLAMDPIERIFEEVHFIHPGQRVDGEADGY